MYLKLLKFPSGNQRSRLFPLRRVVRISTAVICVGLLVIAGALLWQARLRSLSTAEATTNNLVGILTQHTERTLDSVDMLLKIVARELGPRADDPVRLSALNANLAQLAQDLPHIMSVRLLDPGTERPLFEFFRSRPTGQEHDREALKAHGENRYLGLYVGQPYFDETSKTWVVGISRRVSGLEGLPGRVVLALLNLEYLNNFYQSIDMGPDGSISLIRTDGVIIARRPFDPSYLGRNVSKALFKSVGDRERGNYETRAITDNVIRVYGFQRIDRAHIIITAGLSRDAILAAWSQEARRGMTIAGIAALIILLSGEMLARVASHRDRMERELMHAASHDALTGLSNRAQFQRHLDLQLGGTKPAEPFCLLLLDIDEFKNVNDTLGHAAGDVLLREAAARLLRIADSPASVGRFGGDEFAIIISGSLTDGVRIARHILEQFRRPLEYDRQSLVTAASIGVTAFPAHASESGELMKNADIALYAAKTGGRNCFAIFEPEMRSEIYERIALHEEVRAAVEADRFVPYYQPQMSVRTGQVSGFEALARWRHPRRGLLTPSFFGSAFDNHDVAISVGRLLLRQILADMRDWRDQGLPFGRIAVNASAAELDDPGFAGWVLQELQGADLPASMLEIEVTEGVLFGKTFNRVQTNLLRLHKAGIRIALDDFGTGYASLTHLKQFPIGVLKIDRGFIHNVESNSADASIVTAVIDMAHGLNIEVVAEGVERPYQLEFLRRIGCTTAQGFLFAKPMAGSRVPAFLRTNRQTPSSDLYEATA